MYLGEALKQGKKARRAADHINCVIREDLRQVDWLSVEDYLANDWEPVKEVREVKGTILSDFHPHDTGHKIVEVVVPCDTPLNADATFRWEE
jgi:hypothetical protein